MNIKFFSGVALLICSLLIGCTNKIIDLNSGNLTLVNREVSLSKEKMNNTIVLNGQKGDGMAVLDAINFNVGTIDIELKGENKPGKSFVGVAFNVQNDSTYEAIYFRPFNFKSEEKIRRAHSIQYISHPKNSWRFLRKHNKGQYEAEYPNAPLPDDWFNVRIRISDKSVKVYDSVSNTELLSVDRLEVQKSDKIGLWTGHNSNGEFRNLKILK